VTIHPNPNPVFNRRHRFQAAHPGVTITPPGGHSRFWVALQDGVILAADRRLRDLLDDLDALLRRDGGGCDG